MSFIATAYTFLITATLVICVLNIIIAVVKKKTLRLLLIFIWLIFVLASVGLTWIYYQDFDAAGYKGSLGELSYVIDGVIGGDTLPKVVLGTDLSILLVGIIYVVTLIRSIINGIRETAKSTHQYLKDSCHNFNAEVKSLFTKPEKPAEPAAADSSPENMMNNDTITPPETNVDEPSESPVESKKE